MFLKSMCVFAVLLASQVSRAGGNSVGEEVCTPEQVVHAFEVQIVNAGPDYSPAMKAQELRQSCEIRNLGRSYWKSTLLVTVQLKSLSFLNLGTLESKFAGRTNNNPRLTAINVAEIRFAFDNGNLPETFEMTADGVQIIEAHIRP